jgi:hypothetical protein
MVCWRKPRLKGSRIYSYGFLAIGLDSPLTALLPFLYYPAKSNDERDLFVSSAKIPVLAVFWFYSGGLVERCRSVLAF